MNRLGSRDRPGIDALLERTLARARMAREPSSADKERVLTALRDYLDDPTGALQDDSALQDDVGLHEGDVLSGVREIVQDAVRPAVSPLARWARPWSALPASVQKLVWVSAVTGGLGFWLGSQPDSAGDPPNGNASKAVTTDVGLSPSRASEATSEPSVTPVASIAPVPIRPSEAPIASLAPAASNAAPVNAVRRAEAPVIAALPAVASPPEPRRTLAPLSPPVERPATAPAARLPEAAAPPSAVSTPAVPPAPAALPPAALPPAALPPAALAPLLGSDSPSTAPPGAASPPAGDPRFLEAVRLVQRAQRAVESGAAGTALSLLDELDARFPAALLNEERLATRVLALCASGAVARAKRVAAELGARNSSSIYAARIAQSCAGNAASSPAAPPAPRR